MTVIMNRDVNYSASIGELIQGTLATLHDGTDRAYPEILMRELAYAAGHSFPLEPQFANGIRVIVSPYLCTVTNEGITVERLHVADSSLRCNCRVSLDEMGRLP